MKQREKYTHKLWANYPPSKNKQKDFWAAYEALLAKLKKERLAIVQTRTIAKAPTPRKKPLPPPAKEKPHAVFKPKKSVYHQRLRSLFIAPFTFLMFILLSESESLSTGKGFVVSMLILFFGVVLPLFHASSTYMFSIAKSGIYIQTALLADRIDYFAWSDINSIEVFENTTGKQHKHTLVIELHQGDRKSFVYYLSRDDHREFVKKVRWQVPHFDCRSDYYYYKP